MHLNNSRKKLEDVVLCYRDGKFINTLTIKECYEISVDNEKGYTYSDYSYEKALVSSETNLKISMGAYTIKRIPDYKEYVKWHIFNHGNPGGGHEVDKLNGWLNCEYETSADEVRTIAALFNKARVTIDD